ncbi:Heat shock factor protein 1 [Dirofilaria immitis]|nr:Heat shock factor protein 1 [Dirofilaria immitis]
MDRKEVRHNDIQPGTILVREHLPAESQSASLSSSSSGTLLIRPAKLLTEVHRQECTDLPGQECQPATTLPMHILQQYRDEEKVPMFLVKMWNILEDPEFQNIICWDKTFNEMIYIDQTDCGPYKQPLNTLKKYSRTQLFLERLQFPCSGSTSVLPSSLAAVFKHNNLNSLIRQLNMYGFRKMTPIEKSSLARSESDQDHLEFSHPNFIQHHPDSYAPKEISVLVDEIRQLREKQRTMENKMAHLVKENEAMWQQVSHLRNQHVKQQHVVNKLVQFLVALVQPSQKRLGKRNLLAIDEIGGKRARTASTSAQLGQPSNLAEIIDRLHREISDNTNGQTKQNLNVFSPQSNQGPIIADVTDEPENGVIVGSTTPAAVVPVSTAAHLQSVSANTSQVPTNSSVSLNPISLSPSLDRQISDELAEYLSGQEQTIDSCRDLLGNCWDTIFTDEMEEDESAERQPLMLEGGDPILALDEVPTTPDLLTPLASPSRN